MAERKVLNKYYPPDFDPSKIPKNSRRKNHQITVRNMLPMNIRCKTCQNLTYKHTKFNMRKEDTGERYVDQIPIFRFYFKCACTAEITFKTDPQNAGYTLESGAVIHNEPCYAKQAVVCEERGDSMQSLEKRTLDSKRKMDILSNLYEIKSMNSRRAHVTNDAMLEALHRPARGPQKELAEEDEALIKFRFPGPNGTGTSETSSKRRKVYNSQTDSLSETSTHDKLNCKEEDQSGQAVLKSSVIKFIPKSLRQQYDDA